MLDDDELVRLVWQQTAQNCGQKLKTFSTPQKLYLALDTISKDANIYIDADLGQNESGEEIAKKLRHFQLALMTINISNNLQIIVNKIAIEFGRTKKRTTKFAFLGYLYK